MLVNVASRVFDALYYDPSMTYPVKVGKILMGVN